MAEKQTMHFTDHLAEVMKVTSTRGALLAAWIEPGRANAMAIGWGLIGSVWSRPIWHVMVRPSRYTYELLEHETVFSVNVMPLSLDPAVQLCGTKSGRDTDKIAETNLAVMPGPATGAPVIEQSVIHYECRVLHTNDILADNLADEVRRENYPSGDYHRLYWGQIIDSRVDPPALDKLF